MIDVSSPLAIRGRAHYSVSPRHAHYFPNEETDRTRKNASSRSRSSARPGGPPGRLTLAAAFLRRINAAATTTSDRNNNQHDIYPRNTQRAQRAAILLPSFRSPRLCNYDFIFMDINYTGRLAVSLYGILIQGCRHNGNPRATRTHCSPARR